MQSAFFVSLNQIMMKSSLFNLFFMAGSVSVLLASCQTFRETTRDMMVESVVDPKTGKRIFVRQQENAPYGVDAAGIYKARKEAKKRKRTEWMENYFF